MTLDVKKYKIDIKNIEKIPPKIKEIDLLNSIKNSRVKILKLEQVKVNKFVNAIHLI
jgi:hypothetical protein